MILLPIILATAGLGLSMTRQEGDWSEETARRLETELISPCCWRQPVAIHQSPQADQMRDEIRRLLAQGMTREEVRNAFVARYGTRILSAPPAAGFLGLSYWLPLAALLAGAILVALYYRTHRRVRDKTAAKRVEVEPQWARRLEEAMRE